jgi:hypothetical protein
VGQEGESQIARFARVLIDANTWARFVDEHARKAAFRDRVERRR